MPYISVNDVRLPRLPRARPHLTHPGDDVAAVTAFADRPVRVAG